ncbi:MAG TPA: GNAT family N-acetyltransferase [Pyrinomonadaceae bacterium]|nr:GNAT family N-acetyltransferase [Pyrinomonadaceae bacterium]
MNNKILIRLASKDDAPAMVEFNQAMAQETEGKFLDREILTGGVEAVFDGSRSSADKGFYVVAESDDGKIVGGLMVTFEWSDWRNSWFWWIQSVYVLPDFRGRKIYRQLYEFVKQKASEAKNVCGFRLYVESENERAQKVYEKLGMQQSHYLMYEEMIR